MSRTPTVLRPTGWRWPAAAVLAGAGLAPLLIRISYWAEGVQPINAWGLHLMIVVAFPLLVHGLALPFQRIELHDDRIVYKRKWLHTYYLNDIQGCSWWIDRAVGLKLDLAGRRFRRKIRLQLYVPARMWTNPAALNQPDLRELKAAVEKAVKTNGGSAREARLEAQLKRWADR